MPQVLLPGDVHVNAPLSNIARAYVQNANNFIAGRVFPTVPVAKQSDMFWRYSRADWNRNNMRMRAPNTESAGAGFGTDRDTYFADVWALHNDISDQTRANADNFFNMDRDATNFLTMKAMINREVNFVSKYLVPGVWEFEADGAAATPGTDEFLQWDDANSTPIEDIRRAKREMQGVTGFMPNKLTLAALVYDKLVDHPDIVDRVKYGQTPGRPAMVNRQALAALFEVDEVLVSEAIVNSAAETTVAGDNENSSFVFQRGALLSFAPTTPSAVMPSAGYTFTWTGLYGGGNDAVRVSRFRMENLKADRIEIEQAYDQKVIAADLGYFFNSAISDGAPASS